MVPYVIRQGDFLDRIALRFGFQAQKVWAAPENAKLRQLRTNPNVLSPGDVLYIPDPAKAKKKWLPVAVGAANKFVATIPTMTLKITLVDDDGPISNKACTVEGCADDPIAMTTGGDGSLSIPVPITCMSLFLVFDDPPARYQVHPGGMDPHEEPSGVCHRLVNLGYLDDPHTPDEVVADAVRAFQSDEGLEPTGVVDDATRAQLVQSHGH